MSTPTAAGTLEYAAPDSASARMIPNVFWHTCLFYGLFTIAALGLASFVTLRLGYPLPLTVAVKGVIDHASRSDSLNDLFRGDTANLVMLLEFVAAIALTGAAAVRRRWTSAARALAITGATSLTIATCAANGSSIGAALYVLTHTPTKLIGRGGGEVWLTLDRLLDSTAFCVIVIALCARTLSSAARRRLIGALLAVSASIALVAGWHTFDFHGELRSTAFVISQLLGPRRFSADGSSPSIYHGLLLVGSTVQAIVLAAGIAMWFGARRWRSWTTLAGCISLAIAIAAIASIMLSASLNLTGRDFAVRPAPLRVAWQFSLGMEWAKFTVTSMLLWCFVLAVAREPARPLDTPTPSGR